MGLLDILNGMQNGPRGQSPSAPAGSGGMSPVTMALLGLLAYKAVKQMGSGSDAQATPGASGGLLGGLGGIGSMLQGQLGGLLAGGAAGSILSGGLGDLVKQFQQGGLGDTAKSWVGTGPNQEISPNDLSKVLSEDQISTLTKQSGLSRDALIAALSQHLPDLINKLTPDGRLPTEHEASRLL